MRLNPEVGPCVARTVYSSRCDEIRLQKAWLRLLTHGFTYPPQLHDLGSEHTHWCILGASVRRDRLHLTWSPVGETPTEVEHSVAIFSLSSSALNHWTNHNLTFHCTLLLYCEWRDGRKMAFSWWSERPPADGIFGINRTGKLIRCQPMLKYGNTNNSSPYVSPLLLLLLGYFVT